MGLFVEFFVEVLLQFVGCETLACHALFCDRYFAGLFAYDDRNGIGLFRYADCGTVSQSHGDGYVQVLAYRQYAACGFYLVLRYDDGSVVQRRVLEKDGLQEL